MRSVSVQNYGEHEGECACGCGQRWADSFVIRLQAFVFVLSAAYGKRVRHLVTSGARCLKHNASLVDAKGNRISSDSSRHVGGHAADGHWEYWDGKDWTRIDSRDVAALAQKSGLFGGVGWIRYIHEGTRIVHLDERESRAVW